ncbi:MAG: hypothetical protein U0223_17320 [Nitrospira sp.]|nr:hypothetical protein [Nitrospira sp.]
MLSALALVLHSGFEFKDNRRESRTAINRGSTGRPKRLFGPRKNSLTAILLFWSMAHIQTV